MKTVYPDYYKDFRCIAHKCRHSCCIGWEIDIDKESLEFYKNVKGEFGEKLINNISFEGTAHFILKEQERCPFLNENNLCDIYTNLGEDKLCQICSDHPRFYNELPYRTEAGLGLCCEEAASLIITKKEPVKLIGEDKYTDSLLLLRSRAFDIITDRSCTVLQRTKNLMALFGIEHKGFDILKWADIFESLERLDEKWTLLLSLLKEELANADTKAFAAFMKNRETEYEQFLHYLIYRHFSKAEFSEDAIVYSAFAILSYELIYNLGAVIFTEKGDFTIDNQLEIIRLFSSEIEYSDENLDIILNELENEILSYCK